MKMGTSTRQAHSRGRALSLVFVPAESGTHFGRKHLGLVTRVPDLEPDIIKLIGNPALHD